MQVLQKPSLRPNDVCNQVEQKKWQKLKPKKYISIERMLYVARCVVASRLLRDRLSDETKANVWPETQDPRERKDHLVAEKMSLQYIDFLSKCSIYWVYFLYLLFSIDQRYYTHLGKEGIGSGKKNLFFLNQYNDFNISQHTKGKKCPKYCFLVGS